MAKSTKNSNTKKSKILPWATSAMLVVGIAVLAAIYWNKNVTVDSVSFNGINLSTEEQLLKVANVNLGVHPDSLDLDMIISNINQVDYVLEAIPYVEPSGELNIQIKERTPIALLMNDSEKSYVDKDGVKLPILDGKSFDVPLVYGFNASLNGDTLNTEEFKQISSFLVGAKQNKFGWMTISEVAYNKEEGVVALSQENGVKLLFGSNDFKTKLENWEAFYSEVIRVKGIKTMQQVDLRFTNQVVTRES